MATELRTSALFDEVVAASGLSSVFARAVIARACQRAGVDPARMTPADLRRALPAIEPAMRVYLTDAGELAKRVAAIARLAG